MYEQCKIRKFAHMQFFDIIICLNVYIDRCRRLRYSTSTTISNETLRGENGNDNERFYSCNGNMDLNNIQIPIVGYEIMEERARFTVSTSAYS